MRDGLHFFAEISVDLPVTGRKFHHTLFNNVRCFALFGVKYSIENKRRINQPISWIDERDDTELGVIADFLETIVDVPVSSHTN